MRYVTYYEECDFITVGKYQQIKQSISTKKKQIQIEKYSFKKLKFLGNISQSMMADYFLCMKDEKEEQIYLEKKFCQNNVCFKKSIPITKGECEQILDGDYEWMKEHKKELLADFYLQITWNHLSPGYMTEYETERIMEKKGQNITFYKKINRGAGIVKSLFEKPEIWIPCLDEGKIMVSYKQSAKLPKILCNMMQGIEVQSEDAEFHAELSVF